MTPLRVGVVILTLLMGALLAVGVWGEGPQQQRLSDDDYISIAISQPEVFRASAPPLGGIAARVVERAATYVAVDVDQGGTKFRVFIDPRTNKVTQVLRQ